MSIWTHVAAIIRIDSIKGFGIGPQSKEELEKVLGPVAEFDGTDEEWNACTLPCGSEGSLQYVIWENEDDHCISAFTVSVFGDLRNYDESMSILFHIPIRHCSIRICGIFCLMGTIG